MKKNNMVSLLIYLFILSFNAQAVSPTEDIVVIDDIRNLQVDENTVLTIDRRPLQNSRAAEQFGTGLFANTLPGFKASMTYIDDGSGNSGTLSEINLINSVVGPVTVNDGTNFKVFSIDLVIDADTVIAGVDQLSDIAVGDMVAASGIENEDGTVKVSRLEFFEIPLPYWLLTGEVSNLNNDSFTIGDQEILLFNNNLETLILCEQSNFENGVKVIAEVQAQTGFTLGNTLDALTVICYEDFTLPIAPPNGVFFNGDITDVNSDSTQITVDGNLVIINAETQIISESGSTTLEVGQNVSINGYEGEDGNQVIAEFIIINEAFTPPPVPTVLFGQISNVNQDTFVLNEQTVQTTPNTEFINGDASDLIDGAFIQLLAGATSPNQPSSVLIAQQITFVDELPPFDDFVSIEGEISNLNNDMSQFSIENDVINVTNLTEIVGGNLQDLENGMNVFVQGIRDENTSEVDAQFILLDFGNPVDPPPAHVCVAGSVTSVNADQSQFELDNGAIINVTTDTEFFEGSQSDLVVGASVEVGGIPSDVNNEIQAEVIFFVPEPEPETVFFGGFISNIADDNSQITIDGQVVNITADTEINGGIEALAIGVEVFVFGQYDPATGEITAETITVPNTRVTASAPVRPQDVTLSSGNSANGVIVIMGMEVRQTELTLDPQNIFVDGLDQEKVVAMYGFQDSNGVITASAVFTTPAGQPGTDRLILQGQVTGYDSNAITLTVQNVNIGNLDNATFVGDDVQPITAQEFFANLDIGDIVTVGDAVSYDFDTNTLNAGVIVKSSDSENGPAGVNTINSSHNRAQGDSISGSGTITSVIEDRIFTSSF